MNILQIQDQLKNYSQEQLVQEMTAPSGQIPQFLTLSEMNRRKKMQMDLQSQQSQQRQTTVAEDAIAGAGVPQGGLQSMAQSMAPKSSLAQNTGVEPTPGMAEGGLVGGRMVPYASVSRAGGYRDQYGRVLAPYSAGEEYVPISLQLGEMAMDRISRPAFSDRDIERPYSADYPYSPSGMNADEGYTPRFNAVEEVLDPTTGETFQTRPNTPVGRDMYGREIGYDLGLPEMSAPQPGGGVGIGGLPPVAAGPEGGPPPPLGVPAPGGGSPRMIDVMRELPPSNVAAEDQLMSMGVVAPSGPAAVPGMPFDESVAGVLSRGAAPGDRDLYEMLYSGRGIREEAPTATPERPGLDTSWMTPIDQLRAGVAPEDVTPGPLQGPPAPVAEPTAPSEDTGLTFGLPSVQGPRDGPELTFGDIDPTSPAPAQERTGGGSASASGGAAAPPSYSKAAELLAARMDELDEAEAQNRALALAEMGLSLMTGGSGNFGMDLGAAGLAGLQAMREGQSDIDARMQSLQDAEINMAMAQEDAAFKARMAAAARAAKSNAPVALKQWQIEARLAPIMYEIDTLERQLEGTTDPLSGVTTPPSPEEQAQITSRINELQTIAQNLYTAGGVPALAPAQLPEG